MAGKRIDYLDLTKTVAIYLVIFGHCLIRLDKDLSTGGQLSEFIYSFHMPLFMIVSGLFVCSSLKLDLKTLVTKKFKQLVVPAITCTIISCLYFYIVRDNYNYRDEIIGNSWFLKTLFVCYLLFWFVKKVPLPDCVLCFLSCSILMLIPHSYSLQVNWLFPFFWIGYFYKKYHNIIVSKINYISLLSIIIYCLLYLYRNSIGFANYIRIDYNTLVTYNDRIIINFLIATSGSIAVMALCNTLVKYSPKSFVRIGQFTLGIYTLQTLILDNTLQDIIMNDVENWFLLNIVISPILSFTIMIICIWIIKILSCNKILDLIFFGGAYYSQTRKIKE